MVKKKSRDKCTLTKLSSFEENKGKLFISGKLMENKEFVQSIKEAQSELRKKIPGKIIISNSFLWATFSKIQLRKLIR